MAEKSPSPERQLLKLIENGGSSETESLRRRRWAGVFSPAALKGLAAGWASFWKRRLSRAPRSAAAPVRRRGWGKPGLAGVNRILVVASAALAIYVIGDTFASTVQMRQSPALAIRPQAASVSAAPPAASPVQEAAYYLQKVSSRDIFKEESSAPAPAKKTAAPAEPPAVTKNLSLVGISWSSNPDVIIEDKELKRTYFVKRGQAVGDGVKVEAIYKDRVVLSYEGTEFELR